MSISLKIHKAKYTYWFTLEVGVYYTKPYFNRVNEQTSPICTHEFQWESLSCSTQRIITIQTNIWEICQSLTYLNQPTDQLTDQPSDQPLIASRLGLPISTHLSTRPLSLQIVGWPPPSAQQARHVRAMLAHWRERVYVLVWQLSPLCKYCTFISCDAYAYMFGSRKG